VTNEGAAAKADGGGTAWFVDLKAHATSLPLRWADAKRRVLSDKLV